MFKGKLVVIGIDALEFSLVENMNLSNVIQLEYGFAKVNVPIATPICWATIITGVEPDIHGIIYMRKYKNRFVDWVRRPLRFIKGKRRITDKLGIGWRYYTKEDYKVKTIFDTVKSEVLFLPAYNEPDIHRLLKNRTVEAIKGGYELKKRLEEKVYEIYYSELSEFLNRLSESDVDLFFVYFQILDVLGHIGIGIERGYNEIDLLVKKAKQLISSETKLLILSDHGMLNQDHTPNSFYSSNYPMPFKPLKIIDYYNLMCKALGILTREEELRIVDRLKAIGYI